VSNPFQPRFDRGIYRDCKWCQGRGCLHCEAEADAEYKRQFPDGPKPIVTIERIEGESIEGTLERALGIKFEKPASPQQSAP
jgi:hypothetical protein